MDLVRLCPPGRPAACAAGRGARTCRADSSLLPCSPAFRPSFSRLSSASSFLHSEAPVEGPSPSSVPFRQDRTGTLTPSELKITLERELGCFDPLILVQFLLVHRSGFLRCRQLLLQISTRSPIRLRNRKYGSGQHRCSDEKIAFIAGAKRIHKWLRRATGGSIHW